MCEWTRTYPSRNVAVVTCEFNGAEDEHWVLLRTDAHHDNQCCDQELEAKHLGEALERNASIIDAGDLFCAMQGKYDKRSDRSQLREEHQHGPYLDTLIATAADFYTPYAANWVVLGRGNHEQSIGRHHETDLVARLAERMLDRSGHTVQAGGYQGVVHYMLRLNGKRTGMVVRYAHGAGGAAPVTLGTIQSTNRYPGQFEGADVQFTGHVHNPLYHPKARRYYDRNTQRITERTLHIVQGYTYKDEYGDGHDGYHAEGMRDPRELGAWWMRLTIARNRKGGDDSVAPVVEIRRAV